MAKMSLREYANQWLKSKGTTAGKAKKNADKYKSIAAAKKAGSLYYTDKNGKVQLAVYAEDLKRGVSPKPKLRPTKKADKPKAETKSPKQPKTETTASKTPARSTQDSKAATSRRSSPQRPSAGQKDLPAISISIARVPAKEKFGPSYDTWRKTNSGGIVAYRKDMDKKGLKPRTSAGNR